MRYYVNMIIAMADARYQAAYWEQVSVSEWWLFVVTQITKQDKL
jgi:hypothetical protein